MTTKTKRVVLEAFGGPEGFRTLECDLPEPGPGQLRVRVLAASVQYTDVIIRKGQYTDLKEKPPFTPGYDVVGEVDAVGPGVDEGWIGKRVADLTMVGSYATHRLLRADRVTEVPDGVDPAQAATLVLSWMTAYQLLHRHAEVEPGQSALIVGAAGAVGRPLLHLGRDAGLEMYGSASAKDADLVASFGATPIDYRHEDVAEVLADGVDVVFDGIAEDGFRKSWSVVKKGGFLSAYGLSTAVDQDASFWTTARYFLRPFLWNALPNGKGAGFYSITSLRKKRPDWFREDLATLFEMLAAGSIEPRVQERIRLEDVAEAHRQIERGGLTGKLIIVPA